MLVKGATCSLLRPYGAMDVINIGSFVGLVPSGNKLLPGPKLTYHQSCSVASTWELTNLDVFWKYILKIIHRVQWVKTRHWLDNLTLLAVADVLEHHDAAVNIEYVHYDHVFFHNG